MSAQLGTFAKVPEDKDKGPFCDRSITAEAAWRFDADEIVEIEIDDGLQRFSRRRVTETFGQGIVPRGVFGLT